MMRIIHALIILSLSFSSEFVEGMRIKRNVSVNPRTPSIPSVPDEFQANVLNASIGDGDEDAAVSGIKPDMWTKYVDKKSLWTEYAKWRICGLLLASRFGSYWITGFSKKASKQGGGNKYSTELDVEYDNGCVQYSRFSPGFRVGMKLLGHTVPFDTQPAVNSLRFSWINPIGHIDKRDSASETAIIGTWTHSDEDESEDNCCEVHEVTQRCFEGRISHHCTVWLHFTPRKDSCQCSGKMMMDLCNLDVTMNEALRAKQISDLEAAKAQIVKVQYDLIKRKTSNSLTAFRVKMYPIDKDENGEGETHSVESGARPTMGEVRDLVYEYSEANPFYAFTSNTCQQFSAWMLAKLTNRPELNVPWFNANYVPLLSAAKY